MAIPISWLPIPASPMRTGSAGATVSTRTVSASRWRTLPTQSRAETCTVTGTSSPTGRRFFGTVMLQEPFAVEAVSIGAPLLTRTQTVELASTVPVRVTPAAASAALMYPSPPIWPPPRVSGVTMRSIATFWVRVLDRLSYWSRAVAVT